MDEINRAMLDAAVSVAARGDAGAILLAGALVEEADYLRRKVPPELRVIATLPAGSASPVQSEIELVPLPEVRLRRRGRAKVALLEALAAGILEPGERVVVLSGSEVEDEYRLDTLALVALAASQEKPRDRAEVLRELPRVADPAAFDALLGLCVQLGHEGRDGRRVGFLATLGDEDAVMARSRQAVLNPFAGHGDEASSILNPAARRALREFSGIDGAFVLRSDGVILAGGRYLQELAPRQAVPAGLGARHRAAAGITAATSCIAFTVSESTGDARVFADGRVLMTIERTD